MPQITLFLFGVRTIAHVKNVCSLCFFLKNTKSKS